MFELANFLELESQTQYRPSLVHVENKVILVVVDIQGSVTKNQRNFRVKVVASASKHLPRKMRATTAEIKFAGAGYNLNPKIALIFGYRVLDVDYDKNNFVYDMNQRGPILGLGFRF